MHLAERSRGEGFVLELAEDLFRVFAAGRFELGSREEGMHRRGLHLEAGQFLRRTSWEHRRVAGSGAWPSFIAGPLSNSNSVPEAPPGLLLQPLLLATRPPPSSRKRFCTWYPK